MNKMKKRLLSFLAITMMVATTINAQVPTYSWVKPFYSTAPSGSDPSGLSAIDAAGNTYLTGSFKNSITIGTNVLSSAGGYDVYLAKIDSKGNVIWAKRAGGIDDDVVYAMAVDAQGNSYLTSSYKQTAKFDNITVVSQGYDDFYAAKYDTNGNAVWVNTGNGPLDAFGNGITVDNSGNVYVTGQIWGSNNFSGINLNSNLWNTILVKYQANGKIVYAKVINTSNNSGGRALAIDNAGNCYWAGGYSGNGKFGSTSLTAKGTSDCFLSKLDSIGNFIWAKDIGSVGVTGIWDNGLKLDNLGNVYLSGFFDNSIQLGSTTLSSVGSSDVFLTKVSPTGTYIWAKSYGSVNAESEVNCDVDKIGNLFIINSYIGSTKVGDSSFTAYGGASVQNMSIAEFDSKGNFVYAKNINGTKHIPTSIKVDGLGNLFTTSVFSGTGIFDSNTLINTSNNNGVVVGKLVLDTMSLTSISSFNPTKANTGTTISIKGTSFTGASAVSFGGTAASSFKVVNDSTITAIVGNGASGNVVVVSPNGTASLKGFTFSNSGIPTNGLVGWYPFNGNANDESGHGFNGIVTGAQLSTDRNGNANKAYYLNGQSNYIKVGNFNNADFYSNDFTLSAWYYNYDSSYTKAMMIIAKDSGCYGNQGQFRLNLGEGNAPNYPKNIGMTADGFGQGAISGTILKNGWNHILVVKKGSNSYMYYNGVLASTIKYNPGSTISTNPINYNCYFGARTCRFTCNPSGYDGFFYGKLDDIGIWNRALDSSEVFSVYNYTANSPLPLNITTFTATYQNKLSALRWSSSNETNTANFVVERTSNGSTFSQIGYVTAKGSGYNSYGFTDATPTEANTIYYRLKMIDRDGSYSYSKVVSVNFSDNQSFSIIPNPARDFATLSFSKSLDKATIAVYDITGKQVITQSHNGNTNTYKLNTQSLKSGLYVIKVNTDKGIYNEKLLINK